MKNKSLFGSNQNISDPAFSQQASKRNSLIINSTSDLVVLTDLEGTITYVNKAVTDLYLYEKSELVGKPVSILWKEDNSSSIQNLVKALIKGESFKNMEAECLDKNGGAITVLMSLTGIKNDSGEVIELLGISKEIRTLKQAQESLQASEERYRELVNNLNSGVAIYKVMNDGKSGSDYIIQDFNRFALQHENLKKEEVIGKNLKEIRPNIDDYGLIDTFREVWKTGKTAFFPAKIYVDENFTNYYENKVFKLPSGEIVAVYDDVSERMRAVEELKRKERDLRSLVENPAGYVIYRTRLNREKGKIEVVQVSPSFTTMLGFDDDDKDKFERWFTYVHKDDLPAMTKANEEGMRPPFKLSIEIRYNHPQKGLRWLDIRSNGIPYEDDPNMIEYANGVILDITERKNAEEELIKMEKLSSIGTLAGGIAHDFNNILAVIYGNISFLKMGLDQGNENYRILANVERSIGRAKKLSNQLLTFSKGGAPVKKEVNIAELLKETIAFDLSGSHLKPVLNMTENAPHAEVDAGQIQQAFSNLVINASQASPDGSHLYISLSSCSLDDNELFDLKAGEYLKVAIKDKGKGISKEDLGKIFDPYFTTKDAGNGLGLATTYSIIKKHGGAITVESELEKGSTFAIYLPASEHKGDSEKEVHNKVSKKRKESDSRKILVMDDEEDICQITSMIIQELGHDCDTVLDGEDAVIKYKESIEKNCPYDLIIMDLTVPGGVGGKEALKRVLEINSDAKVIVSSGYSSEASVAEYQVLGFLDVLEKPYTPERLQEVMGNIFK